MALLRAVLGPPARVVRPVKAADPEAMSRQIRDYKLRLEAMDAQVDGQLRSGQILRRRRTGDR